MARRRERSEGFDLGRAKSPHVLDLREYLREKFPQEKQENKRKIIKKFKGKKGQNPVPEIDDALLQEMVLRELAKIESHDVQLTSSVTASKDSANEEPIVGELVDFPAIAYQPPMATLARGLISSNLEVPQDDLVSNFFQKTKGGQTPIRGSDPQTPRAELADAENIKFYLEKSRVFIILAALIAGFLFGGFFVQKGIALKDKTMQKGLLAYQNFASAKDALKDFNFSAASKNFAQAYEGLVSAEEELSKIGSITLSIVKNLPFESRADSSLALLTAAKHVSRAGEILSSAFTLLPMEDAVSVGAFLKVFASGSEGNQASYLINTFDAFAEKITIAETELLLAEKAMQSVEATDFPQDFRGNIAELNERIPALLKLVQITKDYSAISSMLLGKDGPRRYLILFQNSSELRPTGGFIGTYALIEIENGGLKNMVVEGIYDADGQLVVNVVPPKPFQHIATAWSTHDANWFLDFSKSAQKAAWFFERTGNGRVDGVMALNTEVVEQLLALTGPIEIKEYGLTLDSTNFRDEMQYEVEAAYDKKLNKPKKVLADFTPLFLEKLLFVSKEKNKELVSLLINALEEKYIMLYFTDERVQEFFASQGWTGKLHETRNTPARRSLGEGGKHETVSDFLAVVHSNIGGYKTDKFMEDSVDYNAEIKEDGSVISNLVIKRKHNGGSSKYWWYNRKNIDYIKIYVPQGSAIITSSGGLHRKPDAPNYAALGFTRDPDITAIEEGMKFFGQVDIFEESGKTVFGTWLVTDAKSSSELKITYRLPFKVEFANGAGKYNLYWQKQPGTEIDAKFSARAPNSWEVAWSNAESKVLEQDFKLDRDKVIGYIFRK